MIRNTLRLKSPKNQVVIESLMAIMRRITLLTLVFFSGLACAQSPDKNYPEAEEWIVSGQTALVEKLEGRVSVKVTCIKKRMWLTIRPGRNIDGTELGGVVKFDGLEPSALTAGGQSQVVPVDASYSDGKNHMGIRGFHHNDVGGIKLVSGEWVIIFLEKDVNQFLDKLKNIKSSQIFFTLYGKDYDEFMGDPDNEPFKSPLANPNTTVFSISLNGAEKAISEVQSMCI
ncbi:MAG: hypothetical protein K0U54_06190 [Bacteroidetes bacterium]|nr:hypothetical protein [Bacteroidota bacterium]